MTPTTSAVLNKTTQDIVNDFTWDVRINFDAIREKDANGTFFRISATDQERRVQHFIKRFTHATRSFARPIIFYCVEDYFDFTTNKAKPAHGTILIGDIITSMSQRTSLTVDAFRHLLLKSCTQANLQVKPALIDVAFGSRPTSDIRSILRYDAKKVNNNTSMDSCIYGFNSRLINGMKKRYVRTTV